MSRNGILFPLFVVLPLAAFMLMKHQEPLPQQRDFTALQFLFFVSIYLFTAIALVAIRWMRSWIGFDNFLLRHPVARRLLALYLADFIWIMYESQQNTILYIGKYSVINILFCLTMIISLYGIACIIAGKQ